MLRSVLLPCALLAVAASSTRATAQNPVLTEVYGQGVHAFFGRDYPKAYEYFTTAIDQGIQDPRAYYFRGLTASATGRETEAEVDYQAGAEMEAKGSFGGSVGYSLARIQGTCRLDIERFRREARVKYAADAAARSRARYEQLQRDGAPAASREMASPPPARRPTPPPIPPAAVNPFADDDVLAPGTPQVQARDALEGTMTDPFGAEPAPGTAPAGPATAPPADDPFGSPPADDPFGTPAPGTESDPFADPFG